MRFGRGGRMPQAASTASGNFAGCAVASVTIGWGRDASAATFMEADGGVRAEQLAGRGEARGWSGGGLVLGRAAGVEPPGAPPARPG
jgi:hypothetical protein